MGMSPVAGLLVSAEVFPNSLESKISDTPFHTVLSLEKTRNSMSDAAWNMFDNYFSGLIVLRDDVLKQTEGQVDIFVAPEYDGLVKAYASFKMANLEKIKEYEPRIGIHYPPNRNPLKIQFSQ